MQGPIKKNQGNKQKIAKHGMELQTPWILLPDNEMVHTSAACFDTLTNGDVDEMGLHFYFCFERQNGPRETGYPTGQCRQPTPR